MPYGIHKGKKMANVPDEYLRWLYDNNRCSGEVRRYIVENMDAIKENIKRNSNSNHGY
jgi:uncharacterized protein (DUF3820 family)